MSLNWGSSCLSLSFYRHVPPYCRFPFLSTITMEAKTSVRVVTDKSVEKGITFSLQWPCILVFELIFLANLPFAESKGNVCVFVLQHTDPSRWKLLCTVSFAHIHILVFVLGLWLHLTVRFQEVFIFLVFCSYCSTLMCMTESLRDEWATEELSMQGSLSQDSAGICWSHCSLPDVCPC